MPWCTVVCIGALLGAVITHMSLTTIFTMGIIGIFNSINGLVRFDTKKLYTWKKKRVQKTETEKLLGD